MSFVVRKTKYRAWLVTVKQSDCDAAGVVVESKSTFVAHFTAISEETMEALIAEAKAAHPVIKTAVASLEGAAASPLPLAEDEFVPWSLMLKRNAHLFRNLIVGWGPEVKDENGNPIPFTPDALADLVTGPDGMAISSGINDAVREMRYGIAPAKNSNASAAPGEISAPTEAPTSSPTTSPSSE